MVDVSGSSTPSLEVRGWAALRDLSGDLNGIVGAAALKRRPFRTDVRYPRLPSVIWWQSMDRCADARVVLLELRASSEDHQELIDALSSAVDVGYRVLDATKPAERRTTIRREVHEDAKNVLRMISVLRQLQTSR